MIKLSDYLRRAPDLTGAVVVFKDYDQDHYHTPILIHGVQASGPAVSVDYSYLPHNPRSDLNIYGEVSGGSSVATWKALDRHFVYRVSRTYRSLKDPVLRTIIVVGE